MKAITGQIYHVLNKSIANFVVFNGDSEFSRMLETIVFYQGNEKEGFSIFNRAQDYKEKLKILNHPDREKKIQIIAYCLMPTHFHLLLKQLQDNGISKFIGDTLNSYSRYFNKKHCRKGPLWQGRTKQVLVESDEQLMHLTRYIHLNPTTSYLTDNPASWPYSSYNEYLESEGDVLGICKYRDLLGIDTNQYREFTENEIDYQRDLKRMKKYFLE